MVVCSGVARRNGRMSSRKRHRILFWVLFLALLGALIQTKSATITFEDITKGLLVGGGAGFLLGSLFNLMLNK